MLPAVNPAPPDPLTPMMRTLLVLSLAVAAAAVENANVPAGEPGPELREVQAFAAQVTVRNPHPRGVKVAQLDATCACSRLALADKLLLPGGATTLDIAVDNRNRSGDQSLRVTAYLSDPDLDPIEIDLRWRVKPVVAVDAIAPADQPLERPTSPAWRDVYKYVAHERPDELHRLRKRIRLSCPVDEAPPGGLRVEGIDYPGTLWRFSATDQGNGSWLVTGSARDPEAVAPEKVSDERVVIRTNHPDKQTIELILVTTISKEAGRQALDPLLPPPPPR